MQEKRGIAILGSTGSIGTQALEVLAAYPEYFDLQVLTAAKNADLLIEQALKFQPNSVVITDESQYQKVKDALWSADIHVYAGQEALCARLADELLADIREVVQQMRRSDGMDLGPAIEALATPFPRPRLHLQIDGDARVGSLAQAETLLGDQVCDLVGMSRALFADNQLVSKSLAGHADRVTACRFDGHCFRDKSNPQLDRVYCCVNEHYKRPASIRYD